MEHLSGRPAWHGQRSFPASRPARTEIQEHRRLDRHRLPVALAVAAAVAFSGGFLWSVRQFTPSDTQIQTAGAARVAPRTPASPVDETPAQAPELQAEAPAPVPAPAPAVRSQVAGERSTWRASETRSGIEARPRQRRGLHRRVREAQAREPQAGQTPAALVKDAGEAPRHRGALFAAPAPEKQSPEDQVRHAYRRHLRSSRVREEARPQRHRGGDAEEHGEEAPRGEPERTETPAPSEPAPEEP